MFRRTLLWNIYYPGDFHSHFNSHFLNEKLSDLTVDCYNILKLTMRHQSETDCQLSIVGKAVFELYSLHLESR